MKRFVSSGLIVLFAFALLINVSGCGSELKGEAEMKKVIAAMKEASETKDLTKGMEALGKVVAASAELEKLKLTPEETQKLKDKYKGELEKYSDKGGKK